MKYIRTKSQKIYFLARNPPLVLADTP